MIIWRRRLLAAVAVSAVGLSLSACSSSNSPSASPSTSHTTTTNAKSSGSVPLSVPNQDSVRKDVHMTNCGPAQGGWSAGGTVTNSLGHSTTYDITVYFTFVSGDRSVVCVDPGAVECRSVQAVVGHGDVRRTERCALRAQRCRRELSALSMDAGRAPGNRSDSTSGISWKADRPAAAA